MPDKRNFNRDGRPTIFGEPLKRVTFFIQPEHVIWLDQKTNNRSELIRKLINQAMQDDQPPAP